MLSAQACEAGLNAVDTLNGCLCDLVVNTELELDCRRSQRCDRHLSGHLRCQAMTRKKVSRSRESPQKDRLLPSKNVTGMLGRVKALMTRGWRDIKAQMAVQTAESMT